MRAAITYRNLATEQILFHQRDPALAVFAVEIGRLRLVRYTRKGEIVVFQVVRAGESFAESDLFSEVYNCDAIAEVPSRVIVYPKQLLLTVSRDHPDLTTDLMERLTRKSQLLKVRLELRSVRSARDRVLQYLLVIAPPGGTTVNLDRPLKNVANELGLSPEVLYRTLSQLENEGTITRTRGQITLCIPTT